MSFQILPGLIRQSAQHTTAQHNRYAQVAISHTLGTSLGRPGKALEKEELEHVPGSTMSMWNDAARHLIVRASTKRGLHFLIAPAGDDLPGYQIAVQGSRATDWLCHPRTFDILNEHVLNLLGCPVYYYAPQPGVVWTIPRALDAKDPRLRQHVRRIYAAAAGHPAAYRKAQFREELRSPITPDPIICHGGFPAVLGRDCLPPAARPHPTLLHTMVGAV